jgi:hypothetical protein
LIVIGPEGEGEEGDEGDDGDDGPLAVAVTACEVEPVRLALSVAVTFTL